MSAHATSTSCTVALLGNPNTGKSTLFSALAGIHQRVGNYPGVTVEKKTGRMVHEGRSYELIDLPGLYSLSPRSRDEMVALDVLLSRTDCLPVDALLAIVDASNLERNLYLVGQALELGLPTVVVLNMTDVAEAQGQTIDVDSLAQRLGVPVVPVQANRRKGIAALRAALARAIDQPGPACCSPLPEPLQREADQLAAVLALRGDCFSTDPRRLRFGAQRLLLDATGQLHRTLAPGANGQIERHLAEARQRLEAAGCELPGVEADVRHRWAAGIVEGVVRRADVYRVTVSDRLDRVLTHRLWGTLILAVVMMVMFQAVFVWAEAPMAWIETAVEATGARVEAALPEGALRSLLVDGVVHGVGALVAFVPQIAILFFFIALLEDCGYLARGAYLMDKWMLRVGLSGRSFVPMLSSFACAIPGIMAARVVENERDRLTTILAAPLLTCSARLPIYALMIAAFVPGHDYLGGLVDLRGLVLASLYLLGILAAVATALLLKRTLLRGETPLFLMELPGYKWPSLRTALFRVVERVVVFLRCAGTLILAVSILTWAAVYYPHNPRAVEALRARQATLRAELAAMAPNDPARAERQTQLDGLARDVRDQRQRQSWLGRAGRLVEPVVRPLGWDWRIGCAVIASFPAREVVVATMSVIFNQGHDAPPDDDGEVGFHARLKAATWEGTDRPLFNTAVALSVMVFFALCAQCVATLAVMRRETNSWRWPTFAFAYMTGLAYLAALAVYQFSSWMGWA